MLTKINIYEPTGQTLMLFRMYVNKYDTFFPK